MIHRIAPVASLSLFLLALLFCSTRCLAAGSSPQPPAEGLVCWLDASDVGTLTCDQQGRVNQWHSKVGQLTASVLRHGEEGPLLIQHAINDLPALRFAERDGLIIDHPIRKTIGDATAFVVFQRSPAQVDQDKWQRLLSARLDPTIPDTKEPSFHLLSDSDGQPMATKPIIVHREFGGVEIGSLYIGVSSSGGNSLHGDIAEVLLYDRAFLSEGEQRLVLEYLAAKWRARIDESGWTRTGDLGATPKHVRQDLPLSDQENHGSWTLDREFSDEFDGPNLDLKRWHLDPTSPGDWEGREPALFMPSNVEQKDGMLHVTFRKGDVPEMKHHKGYAGYTSALIRTNQRTGYGYYEIRARPMASAGSSSFWFTATDLPDNATEIDVFEIGAKATGFEHKYNMNAHVWKTPSERRHWSVGGVWNAPWKFCDDFHVYGFEWNEKELTWYMDGVAVRRAKNTNWFFPMRLMFDSEAMFSWFGKVDDADLPSTFSIDYLRVWRQAQKS